MRVLLVTQEFPPETHWGGLATYFDALAVALAESGTEVHVLSVVRHQEPSDHVRDGGVYVHRRPLRRWPAVGRVTGLHLSWARWSLARDVARHVDELGIDFDVAETPGWGAECLVLARRKRLPLVVHVFSSAREIFPMLGRIGVDRRFGIRLEEELVRRANLVTGTPAQLGKVAGELGLAAGAVRELRCPVLPLPAAPLFAGPPTVAFAGRFEPRKGPETLIRALPAVRAAVPEVRLVMRGRDSSDLHHDSWVRHLRAMATDLGVADSLELIEGWTTYDEALAAMAASTVVAVPSRWESFGYVAAEAAALGRPVVASDIPALRDLVVDGVTGCLVRADDPDAWAAALIDVLGTAGRAPQLGVAGLERIRRDYDPRIIGLATLDAYRVAIDNWRAGRTAGDSAPDCSAASEKNTG